MRAGVARLGQSSARSVDIISPTEELPLWGVSLGLDLANEMRMKWIRHDSTQQKQGFSLWFSAASFRSFNGFDGFFFSLFLGE